MIHHFFLHLTLYNVQKIHYLLFFLCMMFFQCLIFSFVLIFGYYLLLKIPNPNFGIKHQLNPIIVWKKKEWPASPITMILYTNSFSFVSFIFFFFYFFVWIQNLIFNWNFSKTNKNSYHSSVSSTIFLIIFSQFFIFIKFFNFNFFKCVLIR